MISHFSDASQVGYGAVSYLRFVDADSNASINSSSAHPPTGDRGAFAHVLIPGGGAFAILSRPRGLGISMPRSDPRAFDTRVFESQISLSGRPRPLSKTGLSIRDYCEHDYFVNTTILHFAFKTSPAIFKFMKVELKYWRFMNSNEPIFKTDLASLKYSKPMAFIQENIQWHAIF